MYNATMTRLQAKVDALQAESYEAMANLYTAQGNDSMAADYRNMAARRKAAAEDGYQLANDIDAGKVP